MTKGDVKIGMHASLWAAEWTKQAAELAVPEAAEHGLECIEFPLLVPEGVDAPHSKKLFEKHGVEPTASLCLPEDKMAAEKPEAAEAFVKKALDKASDVGAKFLGGVTFGALGYRSGKPPTQREYDNIVKALKPVAQHARKLGITLGIEPCNRYETHLLNTSTQALKMLEMIDEPNVTIHFDTYHMNIEEKGIGHGLHVAAGKTHYIHMSESDRGVPGTGTIDWNDVFRALAETNFKGKLVVESFVALPPEIAGALCVWRPVAKDRHELLAKGVPFLKGMAKANGLVV
jgi:D-psicose/D-tagatose/L-ribulose 3-epimerase